MTFRGLVVRAVVRVWCIQKQKFLVGIYIRPQVTNNPIAHLFLYSLFAVNYSNIDPWGGISTEIILEDVSCKEF